MTRPKEPPEHPQTKQQAWYAEHVKRYPKCDPDLYERRWAREHDARQKVSKTQRQDVCDELAQAGGAA